MIQTVTKEEWLQWRDSKVTREFIRRVLETREDLKESLAEGEASTDKQLDVVIGRCQGIKDCVNYALYSFDIVDPEGDKEV